MSIREAKKGRIKTGPGHLEPLPEDFDGLDAQSLRELVPVFAAFASRGYVGRHRRRQGAGSRRGADSRQRHRARVATTAAFDLDTDPHAGSDSGSANSARVEGNDPGSFANRVEAEVRTAASHT